MAYKHICMFLNMMLASMKDVVQSFWLQPNGQGQTGNAWASRRQSLLIYVA